MPAAADLASEKLTHGYNDVDAPSGLLSAAQIYDALKYNKLGQVTQHMFGAYGSRVAVTSTFDEPTRRLKAVNVVPELQAEAASWSYDYDDAGNVTQISEAPEAQTADHQCFDYDYLRRLTEAWTPAADDCGAAPSLAGLGGPAPYWHSWAINPIGNRLSETRHAATDTTYAYTYPASGTASVRPHTVTNVTATGATSWSRDYTYDNAGNTTTRPTDSGASQTLTWDREGRLVSQTEGATSTSYLYAADGSRLIRTDASGKTLYLPGGTEVRYDNGTATKKATRYYTCNGQTVAVRTATSLDWIVADHHGTAELSIDATTLAIAKRRTLPYGVTRGTASGTWPTAIDKGLVGGTNDPTGLTHLGAREYDPFIGRFISDDPVTDINSPQQINGYAYANNAPTVVSDADGLRPVCDDDSGRVFACGPDVSRAAETSAAVKDDSSSGANSQDGPTGSSVGPYQAMWCFDNTVNCKTAWKIHDLALKRSNEIGKQLGWAPGDGRLNAFRHSYWMGLLTLYGFSEDEALSLGQAHEDDTDKAGELPGSLDSQADLHNNKVGAAIGDDLRPWWAMGVSGTPTADETRQLEARLLAMIPQGYAMGVCTSDGWLDLRGK